METHRKTPEALFSRHFEAGMPEEKEPQNSYQTPDDGIEQVEKNVEKKDEDYLDYADSI